jgi:poly-gamma-glutamate synthesis protein (capsule biosynthesis protein)
MFPEAFGVFQVKNVFPGKFFRKSKNGIHTQKMEGYIMSTRMSFTAVGDMLVQRRLPHDYPGFSEIVSEISKGDMRFFNLETTIHNYESYGSQYNGGSYLCAPPEALEDAKRFGFNITSFANNHTLDFSYGGVEKTLENLRKAGLPSSGVGLNMQQASAPAYIDCESGRAALIAATSSFNLAAMAGNASHSIIGRPGVNGLRHNVTYTVDPKYAEALKEIADATQMNAQNEVIRAEGYLPPLPENVFEFDALKFEVGEKTGKKTSVHPGDMARIERAIYEAALQADYIVISIHGHEMRGAVKSEGAEFLEEFARRCIDCGAHAVVGHGPHVIRALEIYKGCPIFYSLGDFVLQNENIPKQPADYFELYQLPSDATMHDLFKARDAGFTRGLQTKQEAFETYIPYWEMENGTLTKLTLLATELGFGLPRSRSGWPAPAKDSSILDQLAELSAPYGTKLTIEGNRAEVILS